MFPVTMYGTYDLCFKYVSKTSLVWFLVCEKLYAHNLFVFTQFDSERKQAWLYNTNLYTITKPVLY